MNKLGRLTLKDPLCGITSSAGVRFALLSKQRPLPTYGLCGSGEHLPVLDWSHATFVRHISLPLGLVIE